MSQRNPSDFESVREVARKNKMWSCILNPMSPRYQIWLKIFGGDHDIPLKSIDSFSLNMPPDPAHELQLKSCEAYALGIDQMSNEQKERLIVWVIENYKVDRSNVEQELKTKGFPIRSEDIIISFSLRGFM